MLPLLKEEERRRVGDLLRGTHHHQPTLYMQPSPANRHPHG
jgi:hypothetical protein